MATITKAEIVELAFTRNIDEGHILNSDIAVAVKNYVDAYVDGLDDTSEIYDDYVKPVIAFGVAVNIYNRIASEITDRGVVQMVSEGATTLDADSKLKTLNEFKATLNDLIELMTVAASAAGFDLVYDSEEFDLVGYTGPNKMGVL